MNKKPTSGQLIKQLNDAIERQANNSLRQNDLTMVQMWVLLSLNDKDEKTYSFKELERILGVAQSTCAGIVNRLAIKKLVDCFIDPNDKRMKLVRITPAGEKCCQSAAQNIKELEQTMFRGLSEEEQIIFNGLLQRIYENKRYSKMPCLQHHVQHCQIYRMVHQNSDPIDCHDLTAF